MRNEATRVVLLNRQRRVFLDDQAEGEPLPVSYVEAIELQLAELGFLPTTRLARRMARLAVPALAALEDWIRRTLVAQLGGGVTHEPLFRSFPHDIPRDTHELYLKKICAFYAQAVGEPCLWCGRTGTTHVLQPCHHVICEHCFDGASYSACPACEQPVDRSSPFFRPAIAREVLAVAPAPGAAPAPARFTLIDVGDDLDAAARALFTGFCERTQAMSPDDQAALVAVVRDYGDRVLPWLPAKIPVRETIAWLFGALFYAGTADAVLAAAAPFLTTATDVLRLIAVCSGADASLQAVVVRKPAIPPSRKATMIRSYRFSVVKLRRPVRRALLALLDAMPADALAEDMLRHRSSWVWVGEFLHPHEYARRFPNMARGFQIVRRKAPDGTPAPAFRTYYSRLAAAAQAGDAAAMLALLRPRPGELARRFDHVLRVAGDDPAAVTAAMAAFDAAADQISTPVLLGLYASLPTRIARAERRVYWPKGAVALGHAADDHRPPLRADVVASGRARATDALLRRFAAKPAYPIALIDDALRDVIVPFNERTASKAAIALPRGSRVEVPAGKHVRMFLHWCEPEHGGQPTDVDLSVGFYDAAWNYVGVCSYYQLTCGGFATSAGDLRAAPFPAGASEFVDIDRAGAQAAGVRYAVMVVNNYRGMSFGKLERGFAGVMLRDGADGAHFDPRSVALRFDLAGEHGVFLPLVLDLGTGAASSTMHWLDAYAKGGFEFNNVATSNRAITTVCPNLIGYFGSGVRPSMFELAALHAAARTPRVVIRDAAGAATCYVRAADEPAARFLARILGWDGGLAGALPDASQPVLAALYRRDLELHPDSTCYALIAERAGPTIAASALLA